MIKSRVTVGEREVIDQGTIICHGDETIELQLGGVLSNEYEDAEPLSFIFEFEETGGEPDLETSILDESRVQFTFQNHRKGATLGGTTPLIGAPEPIDIGAFAGQKLYFSYNINSRLKKDDTPFITQLYYNFYLGGEPDEPRE